MKSKTPYKKKRRRVGRGQGSGAGKTSKRGMKGYYSRSGSNATPGFEGGQMTYYRRLPKRGFSHETLKKNIEVINIHTLSALKEKEVTPEVLFKKGIVNKRCDGIKVLGNGKIDFAVTVQAHFFSGSAKTKIEAAGGKAVVITK